MTTYHLVLVEIRPDYNFAFETAILQNFLHQKIPYNSVVFVVLTLLLNVSDRDSIEEEGLNRLLTPQIAIRTNNEQHKLSDPALTPL
ncbi:hypothetical protein [Aliiglaciecola aliphaticivorans]